MLSLVFQLLVRNGRQAQVQTMMSSTQTLSTETPGETRPHIPYPVNKTRYLLRSALNF